MITKKSILIFLIISALLSMTSSAQAAILPSDKPNYEVMATGNNYTAYFSQFNTNGFTYSISGHDFSFSPRKLSYTDANGNITLALGDSHYAQIQNTTDKVYYNNPYGLENQLQYISNPLMIKEIYVIDTLPIPLNSNDWLTMSSIAIYDENLRLRYIGENGTENSWNGTKVKTEEIRLYDTSNNFIFKFPLPIAKDAMDSTMTGHYLIYEESGILHISVRFSYVQLAEMTLPIYLDLSLAEGEVAFGQTEYFIDTLLHVWARGFTLSNERTLLYNPSGTVVATWNDPNYADGWTSLYTHPSNIVGTWKAEFQTKPWLWGEWEVRDTAYTEVILESPDPEPTGTLYGSIENTDGDALSFVTVRAGTGESISTGINNQYVLTVSTGWHDFTASLIGYDSQNKRIYVSQDISQQLDFILTPSNKNPEPPTNEKGVLYGYITSTTGESLDYVTITVDTEEYTYSGNDDQYAMLASTGWHYVSAYRTDYHPQTKYVYINPSGSFTQLDFSLEPEMQSRPDLSITSTDITFEKVN
ncbi:MAG: hypothetical protein KAH86_03485 [Methanosarcinales archaeon]|nr:hypothetical protein [Methanosarcinales archaeon]